MHPELGKCLIWDLRDRPVGRQHGEMTTVVFGGLSADPGWRLRRRTKQHSRVTSHFKLELLQLVVIYHFTESADDQA